MYTDPTGHAYTRWDLSNVKGRKDRDRILELSDDWEFSNAMMSGLSTSGSSYAYWYAKAQSDHSEAESIRSKYRGNKGYGEYSSDSGLTTTVSTNGVVTSDNIVIRSRIYNAMPRIKAPSPIYMKQIILWISQYITTQCMPR
jgi:hypothetical protein